MTSASRSSDDFRFEQHGEVTVIVPSPEFEHMDPTLIADAADLLIAPLEASDPLLLVVDLTDVPFFGSAFISLLLRCWNLANGRDGQMCLVGVRPRARELLHITSLDMIWPIYPTRREALEALLSD